MSTPDRTHSWILYLCLSKVDLASTLSTAGGGYCQGLDGSEKAKAPSTLFTFDRQFNGSVYNEFITE